MLITGYNDYLNMKRGQVTNMLKIDHLSTSYKTIDGDIHVINDLNFEIYDNEIFGIAGESGCGKTTLLKTLYDIVEFPLVIDQGKVILSGEKNGQPSPSSRARSARPGGTTSPMCPRPPRAC